MAKRDQLTAMGPFSPIHQPDEGYSEDPINPSVHNDLAALSATGSPADISAWLASNAASLPVSMRTELTMALLSGLPTSAIADIVHRLNPRLYIDFIQYLPPEVCLKILGYLDPLALASVMQTCKAWYDLSFDRQLWERLYFLEGWKVVDGEIDASEKKANSSLNSSISHIHRIQTNEGHSSKIRFIPNDQDTDTVMGDSDRLTTLNESMYSDSIFGSPTSSFTSNKRGITPMGDMDLDETRSKSMRLEGSFESSSDAKGKQRELVATPETLLPPMFSARTADNIRSTLWMWDGNASRYRVNWKYLYNMRRRLESNWELGKFTTFQLPHPHHPEEGHHDCVYTLQFDKDYVVSGSRDRTMRIWNIKTRRLARAPLSGHHGSVLCLQFDADPMEDLLVSGSSDSNVFIWKFSTGEILQKLTRAHRESVLNVRFDKRILVTSSKDKSIKIFNRRPLHPGDPGYSPETPVVSPATQSVRAYGADPDLGNELAIKPPFTMIGRLDGHTAAVNAIQVRDNTIVSVSGDRSIKVWNWPEQQCVKTIPAHGKGIACVEYDGRRIVSGSSDWEVCIFDAETSLKVAQLRGHGHLVRTVQAGFGDLPYSEYEDEVEAKAVDASYYRAVENGEIDPDSDHRRRTRRKANAGSSLPQDLQAVGAKLPPGGGGGRKYGRIVSGSYDQSIIIWRRDNQGVWKPAHHLRQEEAAAAAQRDAAAQAAALTAQAPVSASGSIPLHPSVQANLSSQSGSGSQLPGISNTPTTRSLPVQGQESMGFQTPTMYRAMIDQVVPLGPTSLQLTLAQHPDLLMQYGYLQAAIERETSPFVRSQLRHVVTTVVIAQNDQSAGGVNPNGPPPPAESSSSIVAAAGSSPSQGSPGSAAGSDAHQAEPAGPAPQHGSHQSSQSSTGGGGGSVPVHSLLQGLPPNLHPATSHLPGLPNTTPGPSQTPSQQQQQQQQQPPPPPPGALPRPPREMANPHHHHHHHPHISPADNAPAWVFKLQFDARRIVCCSKAPVIVGWDFCNGDPELEEASRFFATVD